jgi:hypothetical protein
MGLNVRVPGGWVGTRSSGLRAGPFSMGHAYRRRSRNSEYETITSLIMLPFLAVAAAFYLAAIVLQLVWWLLRLLWWLLSAVCWLTKWALSPLWLPFRTLSRWRRTRRITRKFARPPTGHAYDPTGYARRVSTKSGARLQREAKRRAA